jgi:hypothetical protein
VRRWVPFAVVVGVFVATIPAGVVVSALTPEPHGHWSGHLDTAVAEISMIVIVVVGAALAWRHLGDLVVKLFAGAALTAVLVGLVVMAVGNLRVARSIWRTPYGDEDVGGIGSAISGFVSGHDLVDTGGLWVVIGGVAFAAVLGFSRRVGVRAAVAGVVLSLIPPWLFPAGGVLFLLAYLLFPRDRRMSPADSRRPGEAGRRP